jgi:nitroreductase
MEMLDAIQSRRSRGKMRSDAPPREFIERVLRAAVHAPNHHDTRPWRFFVLTTDARVEFGEALAEAVRRRMGEMDAAKLDGLLMAERAKPMRSPVLIVVGVQSMERDAMTRREDFQSASAALQNMLLAAESLGLAAIWRTGEGVLDAGVKAHFGLQPEDEIAGVLYLGYPDDTLGPMPARERDFDAITEWRGA